MAFTLPDLPFDKKSLQQFISEEGFEYHHGKHHAAYVTKLNAAIENTAYESMPLEEIVKKSAIEKNPAVYNNGAQHWNHDFFWKCMSPNGGGQPAGKIKELLEANFESIEKFKELFSTIAAGLFGSGWTWLVADASGKLSVVPLSNAGNPMVDNLKPLLTIDVWEHAYYIDHRNARPKFIDGFWDVVNWNFVNDLL